MAQNSALRNENTLLKGRVIGNSDGFGGLMAAGLEDESEAGEGFGNRRVPEDIRDAVGRILNPAPGMVGNARELRLFSKSASFLFGLLFIYSYVIIVVAKTCWTEKERRHKSN